MAAIEGLTEAQNACLANVEVGNLVLIHQILPDSDEEDEDEDDSDDEDEDDEGSEEESDEDDDDEHSHSDEGDSDSESEIESGAVTPRPIGAQNPNVAIVDSEHAEHIEDVGRTPIRGYHVLRTENGGQPSDDDTDLPPVTVYLVVKIAKGANGTVNDLSLVPLPYSAHADASVATFQLFGKQCSPGFYTGGTVNQPSISDKEFINVSDLPGGEALRFTVSPQGDYVRSVVFNSKCPACDDGWLRSVTQLEGMVKDYTIPSSLTNEEAVCPSCIGIDLMKEHQDLRAELEAFSRVSDFGAIHAFHGRLAIRRGELGYEFYQFDERKWGYLFDDMVSDDSQDGGRGDHARYETWDEANDPSHGAILHPASDATIDSLPIEKYADVKTEDDAQCVVCREKFDDKQLVMQLPCGHFFCEDGCTFQWLKQYDTCPVCRAQVPPVREEDSDTECDQEDVKTTGGEEQAQVDASGRVLATDADDDVAMLDVD